MEQPAARAEFFTWGGIAGNNTLSIIDSNHTTGLVSGTAGNGGAAGVGGAGGDWTGGAGGAGGTAIIGANIYVGGVTGYNSGSLLLMFLHRATFPEPRVMAGRVPTAKTAAMA